MSAKPSFDVGSVFHSIITQAVLWAAAACWLLEAYMNFRFGYGKAGLGLGLAFLAVAVFAAYLPMKYGRVAEPWGNLPGFCKRLALLFCIGICVGLSQAAGWANLGTLLADSQVARSTAATSRETAAENLAKMRADRAALPTTRAIDAIKAELDLELRKTSKKYPNGDGPNAMLLKAELANAERNVELGKEIEKATRALESKQQVAGGQPELDVLVAAFGPGASANAEDEDVQAQAAATRKNVAFWVPVAITAVIGLFANFGFALAGVGQAPRVDDKTQAFIDSFDVGARRLGAGGARQLHDELVERFGRDAVEQYLPNLAATHNRVPPAPQEMTRPTLPPINGFPPPSQPPRLDQYGGGINIHVGAPAVGQPQTPPQDAPPVRPAQPAAGPPPAPLALPPPVQTGAPVDRSGVLKHTDHLLLFKQACLEPMPSALVSADDMYARYAAWAGPRRLSQAAFLALLSELADVPQSNAAGGHLHFYDFAIRTTQPRAATA